MKIIIASNNQGKLNEFKKLLNEHELFLASDFVKDFDPIENGNSFNENAQIKALALWNSLNEEQKKQFCVISDDSGLCVEALDDKPNIYSARFGDEFKDKISDKDTRNRLKLRTELQKLGIDFSKASFICVICLIKDGEIKFAKGECIGVVGQNEFGTNGFGYDRMFMPDGSDKTFAELSDDEKNKISHRFLAINELKKIL